MRYETFPRRSEDLLFSYPRQSSLTEVLVAFSSWSVFPLEFLKLSSRPTFSCSRIPPADNLTSSSLSTTSTQSHCAFLSPRPHSPASPSCPPATDSPAVRPPGLPPPSPQHPAPNETNVKLTPSTDGQAPRAATPSGRKSSPATSSTPTARTTRASASAWPRWRTTTSVCTIGKRYGHTHLHHRLSLVPKERKSGR